MEGCEKLREINEACKGNAGGILGTCYTDSENLTITYSSDGLDIVGVVTSERFKKIPIKRGRGNFTDTSTIDRASGNSSFSGVLTVRIPRRRKEVVNAIKVMGAGQRDLAVAYKDGNKKCWLMPVAWLSSATANTGENITDANNEEIAFTNEGEWFERGYEISEEIYNSLMDYIEPEINSTSPASAEVGETIAILGGGFTGATSVNFGSTSATFNVINDNVINVVVPAGTGTVNITVETSEGISEPFSFTIDE